MKEHDIVLLIKIRNNANQTVSFKGDLDHDRFVADTKTVATCAMNLIQMGELAAKLSTCFSGSFPHFPLRGL